MKTIPLFLTHVQIGDSLLIRGRPGAEKIAGVREGGIETEAGECVPSLILFQGDAAVVPIEIPESIREIMEAQEPEVRARLIVIRYARNTEEPRFTLANKDTLEALWSRIETAEAAGLSFGSERWEEGKPEVTDCHTEYFVGEDEIAMPDDFDPDRYM